MVDLGMHKFKYLNTGKMTPEESFMNAYTEDFMTGTFHVGESTKGLYDMILGRDKLKELGLHLNDLITSSKQMMNLLKSLRQPWLIWVCTNLNI